MKWAQVPVTREQISARLDVRLHSLLLLLHHLRSPTIVVVRFDVVSLLCHCDYVQVARSGGAVAMLPSTLTGALEVERYRRCFGLGAYSLVPVHLETWGL